MLKPIDASWPDFDDLIHRRIAEAGVRDVCEVGAGANPLLSAEAVRRHGLRYTLVDVDGGELAKAQHPFEQRVVDLSRGRPDERERYDLVFSRMTLEHVRHPARFHANVYRLLRPGGRAVHFFATLYALPSVVNAALPEALSSRLLFYFQRRDPETEGKFPAHYRWTLGPVARNVARFGGLGYEVVGYDGYLGHGYLSRLPRLGALEEAYNRALLRLGNAYLCSSAIVELRRPDVRG